MVGRALQEGRHGGGDALGTAREQAQGCRGVRGLHGHQQHLCRRQALEASDVLVHRHSGVDAQVGVHQIGQATVWRHARLFPWMKYAMVWWVGCWSSHLQQGKRCRAVRAATQQQLRRCPVEILLQRRRAPLQQLPHLLAQPVMLLMNYSFLALQKGAHSPLLHACMLPVQPHAFKGTKQKGAGRLLKPRCGGQACTHREQQGLTWRTRSLIRLQGGRHHEQRQVQAPDGPRGLPHWIKVFS